MMQQIVRKLRDFFDVFFGQSKSYFWLMILTAVLGYGYLLTSISKNGDHCYERVRSVLTAARQGRAGSSLLDLCGLTEFHIPFWSIAVGLIIFILSASVWMAVLNEASDKKIKKSSLLVFALIYLSYPLNYEYFLYPNAFILGATAYLLTAASSFVLVASERSVRSLILSVLLSTFATSIYESFFVVHLWGMLVIYFLHLFYDCDEQPGKSKPCLKWFSINILCTLALFLFIQAIVQKTLGKGPGAARSIAWLLSEKSVWHTILSMSYANIYYYFYNAFFYFAIMVFVIAIPLFFYTCLRFPSKKKYICTVAVLIFGLNFSLSLLLGRDTPYRQAQILTVFVSMSWMLFIDKSKIANWVKIVMILWVVLLQTKEINLWTYYDNIVYEKNATSIKKVGYDLQEQFGRYPEKKIIAINGYTYVKYEAFLPAFPYNIFRNLPRINTINQHAGCAIFGGVSAFPLLFDEITGIQISYPTEEDAALYQQRILNTNQPGWPKAGYITEYDDCILINLGEPPINRNDAQTPADWLKCKFKTLR